jgi:EAL domain-containing protein (putative c-di-GMP-specific phosphodiesterase class I)
LYAQNIELFSSSNHQRLAATQHFRHHAHPIHPPTKRPNPRPSKRRFAFGLPITGEISAGATVGLEALCRWTDPALGVVPAETFISQSENSGAIVQLGHQVLALLKNDFQNY